MSLLRFGNVAADMGDPEWFGFGAFFADPEPEVINVVFVPGSKFERASQITLLDRVTGSTCDLYGTFEVGSEAALAASVANRVKLSANYGELLLDWSALAITLGEFQRMLESAIEDPEALIAGLLAGADSISGGTGGDVLRGFGGDDSIGGGAGADTAAYAGASGDYTVSSAAHGTSTTVAGEGDARTLDGTDTLTGIDRLRFSDATLLARAGSVARLVNEDQDGRQEDVDLAPLAGGGWVATWTTYSYLDASFFGIVGQRFDATGRPAGAQFVVEEDRAGLQEVSSVTALAGGGFVVAWQGDVDGTSGVAARVFDAGGKPLTADLAIGNAPGEIATAADVAGLRDGGFVVVWRADPTQPGEGGSRVYARRFDGDGVQLGSAFPVSAATSGQQASPAVTALPDGGFMAAWSTSSGWGTQDQVFARSFGPDGAARGGDVLLGGVAGNHVAPALATLADGRVAAAWVSAPAIGVYDGIEGRLMAADGTPLSGVLELSAGWLSPQLAALPDGGFALIDEGLVDASWWAPTMRWFDASGSPTTPSVALTTVPEQYAPFTPRPAIAALPDGRVAVAWQSAADSDIYLREMGRAELEGTAAPDRIRAGGGPQAILGRDGDDTLSAGDDDDLLEGGAGSDAIDGGAGRDTAAWQRASSEYSLRFAGTALVVNDLGGTDGTDTLSGVETLRFADRDVAVASRPPGPYPYAGLPDSLYHFFVVAFGAAPGVTYMDQLAEAYWYGLTVEQIVEIFTTKPQYLDIYPDLRDLQVRTRLVEDLVKASADAAAKQEAVDDIGAALGVGWSVGKVIYTVFGNLARKPIDDPTWGDTARQFANEVAVAKHYTEVLNQSTPDVGTLRDVLRPVTQDSDVASAEAIATLIGAALMEG